MPLLVLIISTPFRFALVKFNHSATTTAYAPPSALQQHYRHHIFYPLMATTLQQT